MPNQVKILTKTKLADNVYSYQTEKPTGFTFDPGQAVLITIGDGGNKLTRALSFTSTPTDPYLEFIVKIYPEHNGFTVRLVGYKVGDTLELGQPFGRLTYRGPGLFLAGGMGICPFVSIVKTVQLTGGMGQSQLIYSARYKRELVHREYLAQLLGNSFCHYFLTREKLAGYRHGRINKSVLQHILASAPSDYFYYLCGPPLFVQDQKTTLLALGVSAQNIVF